MHCCRALALELRAGIAALALATLTVWSAVAHGQANCPDPTHPDRDYNCPVGPIYTTPNWGNVPWLNPEYFETIQTGDVDGDGVDDLIARDASGLHLYMYDVSLGTWKPVLTTQGGSELVLDYFSDAHGWGNSKTYYATIKLVNLRYGAIKLVARGADGLTVFEFTRGPDQLGFPTGSWEQISKAGPFSDKEGWLPPPYGLSLRYGRIVDYTDGAGVVVGWGKSGLETYRWTGLGWTPLPNTPGFGDAAAHAAGVLSLQIASIDNGAPDRLLVIGDKGLAAYAFEPNVGWKIDVSEPTGIFTSAAGCDAGTNSCAYTLQTASLAGESKPVIVARRSGCNKKARGMMGVALNPENGQWRVVFAAGPFDDCAPNTFADVRNFSSIMVADIDGDGNDELIGRGPNGVLAYSWNKSAGRWSPVVTNAPALSDALWASDPAYWASLRTARLDGSKHALLARGSAGMRTWLYNGSTFARPKPYGAFPALDPPSYQAVNAFLRLPNGVRQSYTDGTAPAVMNTYITQLAGICHSEIAANPLQFQQCDPRPGAQNPAFTVTVNQLLRELTYAIAANGYFDRVNLMQAQLFSQEGVEFPSLEVNLQLAQAAQQAASVTPYLNLFTNIAKFVASLLGPEATIVVNGMTVAISVGELFENTPASNKVLQKYADIQATIANLQQQAQNNVLASKQHVAGDYALLTGVGQLVASDVWRLDQGAYLSASRYEFTKWVMQQLLPSLYDTWEVYACTTPNCHPPPNGSNIYKVSADPVTGVDFIGILQKPIGLLPCRGLFGGTFCFFDQVGLPQGLQDLVFGPLTPQCTYSPGAGTGWVYPTNSGAGCSLQAGPSIFFNEGGWSFIRNVCDAYYGGAHGDCLGIGTTSPRVQ